jgi:hypothetical protein
MFTIKKRTDVKNGRFYNLNFFLILRRNEAERKHTARKLTNYNTYSFGMHATKGSIYQLLNLKRTTTHLIPFSFCLFASFFFSVSDQELSCFYRFGAKGKLLHSFSCAYLPEAPLARACIAHMSTAPLLDWISTSFSHDRNLNA